MKIPDPADVYPPGELPQGGRLRLQTPSGRDNKSASVNVGEMLGIQKAVEWATAAKVSVTIQYDSKYAEAHARGRSRVRKNAEQVSARTPRGGESGERGHHDRVEAHEGAQWGHLERQSRRAGQAGSKAMLWGRRGAQRREAAG